MENQYTIDQLATKSKVSITSINNLKKKNQELFNNNSKRRQRKIYYNQAVMDFCLSYYFPDEDLNTDKMGLSAEDIDTEDPKAENSPSESLSTDKPHESQSDATQAEITALKAEISSLKKQLEEKELERKELIRQNGALILTLQQEKQEKQLFLPAPKKSFSDKVKSIFKGKAQEKQFRSNTHFFSFCFSALVRITHLIVFNFLPLSICWGKKLNTHFFSIITHFFSLLTLIFSPFNTHFFSFQPMEVLYFLIFAPFN